MGVVIGATLPVMLGSVGLAVDVAQWTLAKRSLQRQADSAALAGVYGLSQGADTQASVTRDLALNARYSLDGPPIIERGPSAGPYAGDGRAVRVALATVLNQNRTYSPGTYTNVDIKGTATLNPGVYYIDGGEFSVGSQAVLNAQGVTIILTSRTAASNPSSVAGVNINGGATLNMTASTTGTYQGVLFYQDRLATNQSHKINGNSASTLQGAIYFPSSTIDFLGTTGMNSACIQLVARQLTFSGNSTITNVCPAGQGSKAFAGYTVRLVA